MDHWVDAEGNAVSGIMGAFVDLSINDMKDGNKIQDSIQHIKVADVLGLYEEDGVWYNSDGTKATGVMAALAGTEVGSISTTMQQITIGEMLGLYKDENGIWRNSNGTKASGAIVAIADANVNNLNEKLNEMTLGEFLGYVYLEADDENANSGEGWYNYNETTNTYTKAAGVIGALAGSNLTSLEANLKLLQVGEIAGYTQGADGKWYNSDNTEATGILAELSNLTVDELTNESALTDAIRNVTLAEALGYTPVYAKDANGDYVIDENGDKAVDHWLDSNNNKITGIMAALAGKPINDMGSAVDTLTLDQIFGGDKTGLLSIIPGDTPISQIDGAIDSSLKTSPLQFYIDKGLVSFDATTMNMLDALCYKKELELRNNKYLVPLESINDNYRDSYATQYEITISVMGIEQTVTIDGKVPSWRTQPLQNSFGYIVELLSSSYN